MFSKLLYKRNHKNILLIAQHVTPFSDYVLLNIPTMKYENRVKIHDYENSRVYLCRGQLIVNDLYLNYLQEMENNFKVKIVYIVSYVQRDRLIAIILLC